MIELILIVTAVIFTAVIIKLHNGKSKSKSVGRLKKSKYYGKKEIRRKCPICSMELAKDEPLYASRSNDKILVHGCPYCFKNDT